MQKQPKEGQGPKSIPSQVQLPGGVTLKGMPFKIVAYNPDGSPKLFELLFASEKLLRNPWPGKGASGNT